MLVALVGGLGYWYRGRATGTPPPAPRPPMATPISELPAAPPLEDASALFAAGAAAEAVTDEPTTESPTDDTAEPEAAEAEATDADPTEPADTEPDGPPTSA